MHIPDPLIDIIEQYPCLTATTSSAATSPLVLRTVYTWEGEPTVHTLMPFVKTQCVMTQVIVKTQIAVPLWKV